MAPPADGERGRDLLRFITCGSVDDGKSTLIGRLLWDGGMLPQDEVAALNAGSVRPGRSGGLDFAALVDGLAAEREQGITIDVAYRAFATQRRAFIVADTPGHVHYTRNMVTGASTADAAVILVDARKGVLTQTRRHSLLAHLIGIRHLVLAVNKMDLVGFAQGRFDEIVADYRKFADRAGLAGFTAIPLCALTGANVAAPSPDMAWHDGPTLIAHLEGIHLDDAAGPLRMPVQWVNRAQVDDRGFCGLITSGAVGVGDPVRILPSGRDTTVTGIQAPRGKVDRAVAGQSVTLHLADALDCARGDVIAAAADPPQAAQQFEATIIWMHDDPLLPGRAYWLHIGTQVASAQVHQPKYEINVDTFERLAAPRLALNAIGVATLSTDRPIVFEPYETNRDLGGFILVDKASNATVAAGLLHFALRRSQNVQWQPTAIDRADRAEMKQQRPKVLWLTGLSGAGKSTIANHLEVKLAAMGRHTFLLDGDNVRHGLNRDLGFTEADRVENIRRVGEVARLMTDAGLIVIAAFISPFRAERQMVRDLMPEGEFVEIFVDTPLAEAERRDPKGLYRKARAGELANFTGIDSPYEPPKAPDIRIDTHKMSAEDAADFIIAQMMD